jgi:glutamate formiminotransferase / formiminotetrahydrofolate cyclodeaminase
MKKLIECVPNFSEGKNMQIIKQITDEIERVKGVKLLDVDPGESTNRTVVTLVGTPEEVCEAAFRAVKKAAELIDMSTHKGAHPRFGATDVCPLVPVANVSMEEVVEYARKLAKRIGDELGIPVYCYEEAAFDPKRKNLAFCRSGEYEGLQNKIVQPEWKPDFGPAQFNARAGATAVGARDFLVAINYNLNTTSERRANAIAFDVRERGRPARDGNPVTGKIKKDEQGNDIMIPGSLKATKAIGWFIEEYGIAQVSMNITNISVTPVHIAFDEVTEKARQRGIRVTGSEIVGLIPKRVLIDAGKHYLAKQQRSLGVSENELIKIALKSMGLDDLKPFHAREKVIEYILEDAEKTKKLVDMTCVEFSDETASESPAPGGGSVAAYMGALGAALATMVANLSSHKRGWDEKWEFFSRWAEKGEAIKNELIHLVDEDTNSFNLIMDAFSLPKKTEEEAAARKKAIQDTTLYAAQVPLNTMKTTFSAYELCKAMASEGMSSSASDVGVCALALTAGIKGAMLNVKINASQLDDKKMVAQLIEEADQLVENAEKMQEEILQIVMANIQK